MSNVFWNIAFRVIFCHLFMTIAQSSQCYAIFRYKALRLDKSNPITLSKWNHFNYRSKLFYYNYISTSPHEVRNAIVIYGVIFSVKCHSGPICWIYADLVALYSEVVFAYI